LFIVATVSSYYILLFELFFANAKVHAILILYFFVLFTFSLLKSVGLNPKTRNCVAVQYSSCRNLNPALKYFQLNYYAVRCSVTCESPSCTSFARGYPCWTPSGVGISSDRNFVIFTYFFAIFRVLPFAYFRVLSS
jgi:hypothetical protein